MRTRDQGNAAEVYQTLAEVVSEQAKIRKEQSTLGQKLDKAVMDYMELAKSGKRLVAILVDLPGNDEKRPKKDEYDWMRENMPVIRLKRASEGNLFEDAWGRGWFYEMYRQIKEGLGQNFRPNQADKVDGLLPIEWARVYQEVCKRGLAAAAEYQPKETGQKEEGSD